MMFGPSHPDYVPKDNDTAVKGPQNANKDHQRNAIGTENMETDIKSIKQVEIRLSDVDIEKLMRGLDLYEPLNGEEDIIIRLTREENEHREYR